MSLEDEKLERLADLLRYIDLMVRQACRRAYHQSKTKQHVFLEDMDSIYSLDHLRLVYENPREYIYQLVKNPQMTLKGLRVENPDLLKKENYEEHTKFTKIEQKMLLDFVKKVQDQAPKHHFVWVDMQHYLYYAYRNFVNPCPSNTTEPLSAVFIAEMSEMMKCLKKVDESQLWLRVFTLLREYCIFAQWHYSRNDKEEPLKKFLVYYESMLMAAKNLLSVFSDFERDVLCRYYGCCWIDFNTFIFIRFFYESEKVKFRIDECISSKKSPGDTFQTYLLFDKLKRTWSEHQSAIALFNQEGKLLESTDEYAREKKVLNAHKKLLTFNFWVDRSEEAKNAVDMDRIDHNLFDLLKDRYFSPEGPGLNKNGQCICEDCLIAKYKVYLDSNDDFSIIDTEERTVHCRKCKCIVNLDSFQRHVNSHNHSPGEPKDFAKPSSLTKIISEKIDFVKPPETSLSQLFHEKLKVSDIAAQKIRVERYKTELDKAFETFVQSRKDQKRDSKGKNGRFPSLREELIANGFGKAKIDESERPVSPTVTPDQIAETESMLRELRKSGHKSHHSANSDKNSSTDHPVKREFGNLQSSKGCDCTYCEVFGTQKVMEPRDKLRMRLNKRKQLRQAATNTQTVQNMDNVKVVTDARVPIPPCPSPASTPDLSDHSCSSGKMNEIRGLVNYIEGNPVKNKAELAQKKAAKKARQREKRDHDKIQAEMEEERKKEEAKRIEEAKKKKQQAELDRQNENMKQEEAKMKKKLKKQRQAQKRQEAVVQSNTIEETIPAFITIKQVAGAQNSAKSVTITLKGCTPDQDKLLTTLVENHIDTSIQLKEADKGILKSTSNKKKTKLSKEVPKPKTVDINQLLKEPKSIAPDVKVKLTVDIEDKKQKPVEIVPDKASNKQAKKQKPRPRVEREPTEDEIKALGNFKLPPGITITKIENPNNTRTCQATPNLGHSSLGDKTGVIVVDTEKLAKDKGKPEVNGTNTKKSKKKKNKTANIQTKVVDHPNAPKMVTLRNPMFQQLQFQDTVPKPSANPEEPAPAAIFTRENGMVTIRSSRLHQSMEHAKAPAMVPIVSDAPNLINPNKYNPQSFPNAFTKPKERRNVSTLDAQEILSGLPGIEITKIDKKYDAKTETLHEQRTPCHADHVSIISSNGTTVEFDKEEDWIYDNVFKPRDVLEEDMDDEELELEAFKRFCSQSVPPKEKKVARFNVADIVLKKKSA